MGDMEGGVNSDWRYVDDGIAFGEKHEMVCLHFDGCRSFLPLQFAPIVFFFFLRFVDRNRTGDIYGIHRHECDQQNNNLKITKNAKVPFFIAGTPSR